MELDQGGNPGVRGRVERLGRAGEPLKPFQMAGRLQELIYVLDLRRLGDELDVLLDDLDVFL